MALALYRKYRPATFAEVVGQEHVTDPLRTALQWGRINHAYLFSGPRGCGKTSSARILARSLNCVQGPTPEPCGVCSSCVSLAPGGPGNIDVTELDAASHGGVDDTRELRDRAFFAPAESRYRVFIIDEAHMITTQGFNALLKIVEEPPEHLVFVFATTEPEKVLPTIRSRTHHYPFRLIPPGTLRKLLERICAEEGVAVAPAVYPLVIRAGGGSARDSLSVLDQLVSGAGPEGVTYERAMALLGVTDVSLIDDVVDALAAGDRAAVFEAVDRLVEAGHDPRRFAADLLQRLRDLTLLQAVPEAVDRGLVEAAADEVARMVEQSSRFGAATLTRYGEILHVGLTEMRGATAPRLLLELLCARMLLPAATAGEAGLLERLERLERRSAIAATPPAPGEASAVGEPERRFERPSAAAAPSDGRAGGSAAAPGSGSAPGSTRAAEPGSGSASGLASTTGSGSASESTAATGSTPPPSGSATSGSVAAPGSMHAVAPRRSSENAGEGSGAVPEPPVASTESAETEPPPAPAAAALGAADVRRVWQEIQDVVKQRKKRTAALLVSATVRAVENDTLVLSIGTAPLARLLSEQSNTDVIAEALHAVLGVRWRVRCEYGDGPPPAQAAEQAPRGASPTSAAVSGTGAGGGADGRRSPAPAGETRPGPAPGDRSERTTAGEGTLGSTASELRGRTSTADAPSAGVLLGDASTEPALGAGTASPSAILLSDDPSQGAVPGGGGPAGGAVLAGSPAAVGSGSASDGGAAPGRPVDGPASGGASMGGVVLGHGSPVPADSAGGRPRDHTAQGAQASVLGTGVGSPGGERSGAAPLRATHPGGDVTGAVLLGDGSAGAASADASAGAASGGGSRAAASGGASAGAASGDASAGAASGGASVERVVLAGAQAGGVLLGGSSARGQRPSGGARPRFERRSARLVGAGGADDGVPLPPEPADEDTPPDDEEAMLAELDAGESTQAPSTSDPEQAAMALLSAHLGARAIDHH